MSELSNYIELLLHDEMPKIIKVRIAEMIKEAELNIRPQMGVITGVSTSPRMQVQLAGPPQAASTLAAMARHAEAGIAIAPPIQGEFNHPMPEPTPPAVIAQTPQASLAMQERQAAIRSQIAGKPLDGEKKPRKW